MLETSLIALQDITLDKIFDESGRKALCSDFTKLMHQVSPKQKILLPLGVRIALSQKELKVSTFLIRDLVTYRLVSACQLWDAMSRMNKLLLGKSLKLVTALSIAWPSLL